MRAALLLGCCLSLLAGCGDEKDVALRHEADANLSTMKTMEAELQAVANDLTQFLISDPRATEFCKVEEEVKRFESLFAQLTGPIDAEISATRAFANDGTVDRRFADASAQVAHQQEIIRQIESQIAGAKDASALLHDSTVDRRGFYERATRAWRQQLSDQKAAQPQFNRARNAVGDKAQSTTRDYHDMLKIYEQVKKLYTRIDATYRDALRGARYDCSSWGKDVEQLERLSGRISQIANKARLDWAR